VPRCAIGLVLLVVLVAGCLGQGAPPTPATTDGATTPQSAPVNDDGTAKAAVVSTGAMPHMHDYWKGRERVTLYDGELQPDNENATFATIFQVMFGQSIAAGGMVWDLPDGQTVYEGTGSLELTASWSDPRVTGVGFIYHFYRGGQNGNWHTGGSLPNGKAFSLPITPDMTDMPHAKVSKWELGLGPDKSPGMLMGPFHLKVDIVRTTDIMLFPAHPDFWQGAHELTVFDGDHHGTQVSYVKRAAQPATQGNFTEDEVALIKNVPMGTLGMRFVVNVTSASSTPGQVIQLGLFVRGADTTNMLRCEEKALDKVPSTVIWEIPVKMEQTDSPYNNASDWKFLIEPQTSFTGADGASGGTTDTDITWHGTVLAIDHELKEAMPCRTNENS